MWFDFLYGLKKTKQNIRQLLLLVCCLSIVISAFVMVMAIGIHILKDRPDWFSSTPTLFTLGKTSESGNFMPVAQRELDIIKEFEQINNVGAITLYEQTWFVPAQNRKESVSLAMFNEALMPLLNPIVKKQLNSTFKENSIWVSQQFWQKNQALLPKIGQPIYLSDTVSLNFAGILPIQMNRVGAKQVDFWLSEMHLKELFKLTVQLPPGMSEADFANQIADAKDTAIKRIENRFLVFSTTESLDTQQFKSRLYKRIEASQSNVAFSMQGGGLDYQVIRGVDFSPQIQAKLVNQWWVLLFFVMGFAAITFFNLLSYISAQLVHRQKELNIRMVCGCNLPSLLKQFSLEAIPFLIITALLSAATLFYIYHFVASSDKMISVLGIPLPSPNLLTIAISLVVLVLFAFTAFLSPCFTFFKTSLFSRQVGEGDSKNQKRLHLLIASAQTLVTTLCIFFILSFVHYQWQQRNITQVDEKVLEFKIATQSFNSVNEGLVKNILQQQPSSAFSNSRFIDPNTSYSEVKLLGASSDTGRRIHTIHVSENYFSVIRASFIKYGRVDAQSVVVNQAALRLFGIKNNSNLNTYRLKFDNTSYRIAGVVKDLPHFGQHNLNVPIIYSLFHGKGPFLSGYLLSSASLNTANGTQPLSLESIGELGEQMRNYDLKRTWFIYLSVSLLVLLLVFSIVATYFYSTARMRKLLVYFGTLRAIGIPDKKLFYQCAKLHLVPLAFALGAFGLIISIGATKLAWQIEPWFALFTLFTVFALVFLLSLSGFRLVIKPSINNLLKPT